MHKGIFVQVNVNKPGSVITLQSTSIYSSEKYLLRVVTLVFRGYTSLASVYLQVLVNSSLITAVQVNTPIIKTQDQ